MIPLPKFIKTAVLISGLFINFTLHAQDVSSNTNFEIGKQIEIFINAYKELNYNYVDEVDPTSFMTEGLNNMLKNLDPYTNLIPESQIEDYKMYTTGHYGGIGALVHQDGDYVVISDPYKNSPAQRAGLLSGDKILKINGKNAVGVESEDISQLMKGQPGTMVEIEIKRYGQNDNLIFNIKREVIDIENVSFSELLTPEVGYIKLESFTQNVASQFRDAFTQLKEKGDLKGLIIDLRGNGGGLLEEAVKIINLFVESGQEVVSMRGKIPSKNRTFTTTQAPIDTEIPIIILVDENSASASEILSGSMQDLDRGVVMGQRTFGKGLVQNILPLVYNTQMKVTVAKYYIPSGRCIQAIDYSHKNENGKWDKVPDSIATAFTTKGGRVVYDGAGINPDVASQPYELSEITGSLMSKFIIFNYVTHYYFNHDSISSPETFEIDDAIWNDFMTWINNSNKDYQIPSEEIVASLQEYYQNNTSSESINNALQSLQQAIMNQKNTAFNDNKAEICRMLKMEILSRYYDYKEYLKAVLNFDPEVKQAIALINNNKEYKSLLKPKK
ncbi:MAG: S41 family peptidase [Bacteroidales bacterium]|nr:S41 family peptidase [Bacteroidales bacterium]